MNHVIQYTTAEQFEASTQHIPALWLGRIA